MFATYVYKAGATAANVCADLVALINGQSIDSLSVACNKAASSVGGGASPYFAFDEGYNVVMAPCEYGVRIFRLLVSGATITMSAMEGWNATTHAATNATAAKTAATVNAGGGVIYINAGDALAVVNGDGTRQFSIGIDLNREAEFMRQGSRPSHGIVGPGASAADAALVRVKAPAAVGDSIALAVAIWSPGGVAVTANLRDEQERIYVPMLPAMAVVGGVFYGSVRGVYRIADGVGNNGDTLQNAYGETYMIMRASDTYGYAVRVG